VTRRPARCAAYWGAIGFLPEYVVFHLFRLRILLLLGYATSSLRKLLSTRRHLLQRLKTTISSSSLCCALLCWSNLVTISFTTSYPTTRFKKTFFQHHRWINGFWATKALDSLYSLASSRYPSLLSYLFWNTITKCFILLGGRHVRQKKMETCTAYFFNE